MSNTVLRNEADIGVLASLDQDVRSIIQKNREKILRTLLTKNSWGFAPDKGVFF